MAFFNILCSLLRADIGIMDGQNLLAKCLKGLTIMREGLLQADAIKTDRVMSSLLSKWPDQTHYGQVLWKKVHKLQKFFFIVLNLSFHQPATKKNLSNVRQSFLVLLQFKKRRGQTVSSFIKLRYQQKTLTEMLFVS